MKMIDRHRLTLRAYPENEPYERWQITNEDGEVIVEGEMPIDEELVRDRCQAYHKRIDWEMGNGKKTKI